VGPNQTYPSRPLSAGGVSPDGLGQVEPPDPDPKWSRPFSLSAEELGKLPATLATEPLAVLARVRYPAMSVHVRGRAIAWTPKAVYIEWEHRGPHCAWVWASAVERGWGPAVAMEPLTSMMLLGLGVPGSARWEHLP
jgi:hypothetical protein